jgi:hypothetical protein
MVTDSNKMVILLFVLLYCTLNEKNSNYCLCLPVFSLTVILVGKKK